jgi:hypothetical protein
MLDFIRNWLGEKSTWAGIFMLVSAFNVASLTEPQKAAIAAVGISLVARQDKAGAK